MSKISRPTRTSSVRNLVYIAMFTALIAVCAQISLPIGPVPFTLQTMAVFITAALLGPKRGTISILVYLLLGLLGAPVFAGFTGGIGTVVTPPFGYIVGFIPTTLAVGFGTRIYGFKALPLTLSLVTGLILCYIVGTVWFLLVYAPTQGGMSLGLALSYCVWPFLIPDACKIAASVILINRLGKLIRL